MVDGMLEEMDEESAEIAIKALEKEGYIVALGWQPIETVPKDGTLVDLWCSGQKHRMPDCKYEDPEYGEEPPKWKQKYQETEAFWYLDDDDMEGVTHWMRAPPPPS